MRFKKFYNFSLAELMESKINDEELLEWLLTYLARKAVFGTEACSQIKKEAETENIRISPQRIRKVLEKFGFAKGRKSEMGETNIPGSHAKTWTFKASEICLTDKGKREVFNRFKKTYKQDWVVVGGGAMKRDEFITKMEKELK